MEEFQTVKLISIQPFFRLRLQVLFIEEGNQSTQSTSSLTGDFNSLPAEIRQFIFSFLEDYSDVLRVSMVCRQWRYDARSIGWVQLPRNPRVRVTSNWLLSLPEPLTCFTLSRLTREERQPHALVERYVQLWDEPKQIKVENATFQVQRGHFRHGIMDVVEFEGTYKIIIHHHGEVAPAAILKLFRINSLDSPTTTESDEVSLAESTSDDDFSSPSCSSSLGDEDNSSEEAKETQSSQ